MGVIVVTGCPRSGTTYFAAWLRSKGLAIGHEVMDEDGIVDWRLAPTARYYAHVLLLVRAPLAVIASMTTITEKSRHRLGDPQTIPDFGRVWVRWNQLVLPYAHEVVRIEDVPAIDTDRNCRPHATITPDALGDAADAVRELASRFGYELPASRGSACAETP